MISKMEGKAEHRYSISSAQGGQLHRSRKARVNTTVLSVRTTKLWEEARRQVAAKRHGKESKAGARSTNADRPTKKVQYDSPVRSAQRKNANIHCLHFGHLKERMEEWKVSDFVIILTIPY